MFNLGYLYKLFYKLGAPEFSFFHHRPPFCTLTYNLYNQNGRGTVES